jgi:hypothetical protein
MIAGITAVHRRLGESHELIRPAYDEQGQALRKGTVEQLLKEVSARTGEESG